MNRRDIAALGPRAFQQRLGPLAPRRERRGRDIILGFDTEYDSRDGSPVSMQLSHEGREYFRALRSRLSTTDLGEVMVDMANAGEEDRVIAATYWSPAELSTLDGDWWAQGRVVPVNGQGVFNLEWEHDSGSQLCLYDVFHWFDPAPLKKVAEAFGMKKLDWDRENVSADDLKKPGFREYAMNDAHLAERILNGLRDEMASRGLDVIRSRTPASASMRAYREGWLKTNVRQTDYALRRVAMRANLGGIGEAYVHADLVGKFVQIDADSLYPTSVAALAALPARSQDWTRLRLHQRPAPETEGIVKVKFRFPREEMYPCLPVVQEGLGMAYPSGGISYCTLAEARVAEAFGAKVDYWQAWTYRPQECDTTFQKYLASLLEAKRRHDAEGATVKRVADKFLLNAGIGKYSQRRGADLEDLKQISKDEGVPLEVVTSPSFKHEKKVRRGEPGDSWMPEWHALILGKARALMFPYMRAARSLMTTTDSILATKTGAEAALALGGVLKWKIEGTADRVRIVRQRLYSMENGKLAHHALHMRSEKARALMDSTPLGGSATYQAQKRVSLLDAIGHKGLYGAPRQRAFTYSATWSGKRKLNADGTTRPWLDLDEWRAFAKPENPIPQIGATPRHSS